MGISVFNAESELISLHQELQGCTACPLSLGRTNIVFGEGCVYPHVLFIGEAPGQAEDETGRPFVGRSGELLNKAIEAAGGTREQVYIANVNKCRPPNNRPPTPEEQNTCGDFLFRQIKIINPRVIVPLGKTSSSYILGRELKITRDRGIKFHSSRFLNSVIIPTFHPSYILRNRGTEKEYLFFNDVEKALNFTGV